MNQLLITFFAVIILLFIVIFIKFFIPIYRFQVLASAANIFYKTLITFQDQEIEESVKITCKEGFVTLKFEFTDIVDGCNQFEELINETLSYYDQLGIFANISYEMELDKRELISMLVEIKALRRKKQ